MIEKAKQGRGRLRLTLASWLLIRSPSSNSSLRADAMGFKCSMAVIARSKNHRTDRFSARACASSNR